VVNWLQGSSILKKKDDGEEKLSENRVENERNEENNSRKSQLVKEAREVSNWARTWAGLKRCFALYAFIMVWLVGTRLG